MRIVLDLRGWIGADPFAPRGSLLAQLVPALVDQAEAEGLELHLLIDEGDPREIPDLQRRFAQLVARRRLHVLPGLEAGAPSPQSALLELFALRGLDPDLVIVPGELENAPDPLWLAGQLGPKMPLVHMGTTEISGQIRENNILEASHNPIEPAYLLSIGPASGAGLIPAEVLVAAHAALPSAPRLVLAGRFTAAESTDLLGLATGAERLTLIPDLDPEEVPDLLRGARLVIDRARKETPTAIVSAAREAGVPVMAAPDKALAKALSAALKDPKSLPGGPAIDWKATAQRLWRSFIPEARLRKRHLLPDWATLQARLDGLEEDCIAALRSHTASLDEAALAALARALKRTRLMLTEAHRGPDMCAPDPRRLWRLEGPFDSSYSLAAVNRETARALTRADWEVALFSAEGPGPYAPDRAYLEGHPDLAPLQARAEQAGPLETPILSRNMYPPRCEDMQARMNLLHGYAWEETGFPAAYLRDINASLQGMLVTAPHVRDLMINAGVTVPLAVVGNGVDHIDIDPAPLPFDLPQAKYLILHVSSCFPRKGPEALLEGFAAAFSGDGQAAQEVCLLIKTFDNPHNEIAEQVAALRATHPVLPPIRIEMEDLDAAQMRALYEAADLLLMPSRAEGFCLPVAEAVLAGTPVLMTGWSGQMVFADNPMVRLIDYAFAPAQSHLGAGESVWAEPDVAQMARALRSARANPPSAAERAEGAARVRAEHSWDGVAARSTAALDRWAATPPAPPPRIAWVSSWNTRCGIATYSDHLLAALPDRPLILADHSDDRQAREAPRVRRCWRNHKSDDLSELRAQIAASEVEMVVIQFNYGFFDFPALSRLIYWLKGTGRSVVLMMHRTDDDTHPPENRLSAMVPALKLCDRLLVHSVHDLNHLKALGCVDNVASFPHGVPENWARPQPALTPDDPVILGTYGFLLPQKGYLELIEALALMRAEGHNVMLRMVNAEYPAALSSELKETLRDRIKERGLGDHVDLCTDFLSDAESVERLSEAHLMVFPYRTTTESASGAIRQALALSRPIAVTPQPIFDDVSGLVVPLPGFSPPEMARGLGGLVRELREGREGALSRTIAAGDAWRARTGYGPLARRLWAILCTLHRQT